MAKAIPYPSPPLAGEAFVLRQLRADDYPMARDIREQRLVDSRRGEGWMPPRGRPPVGQGHPRQARRRLAVLLVKTLQRARGARTRPQRGRQAATNTKPPRDPPQHVRNRMPRRSPPHCCHSLALTASARQDGYPPRGSQCGPITSLSHGCHSLVGFLGTPVSDASVRRWWVLLRPAGDCAYERRLAEEG